jgi:UDP-2-acetamido-3-amino-2,3-dideoxy-glucuronate N-acetyltransferase
VGMGSLVTKSIPDFHLALGHPARSVGAVCRCGQPLLRFPEPGVILDEDVTCSACGLVYHIHNRDVVELTPPLS